MAQKKERADELVFLQNLAESREQAKRLIMAGKIFLVPIANCGAMDFVRVNKPGHKYSVDTKFVVHGTEQFVSRGAYKLLTAIKFFSLDVHDFICLDAGSSTGGFSDCLLQHGAAKVYAVDVGRGQLHERLCNDRRVVSMEGVNLRTAEDTLIPEYVDLIVADVSFISLIKILPSCIRWLKPLGHILALVKPQFELEAYMVKKGVVRDSVLQEKAVNSVVSFCESNLFLIYKGVVPAAIKGPKGNQEYLIYLQKAL